MDNTQRFKVLKDEVSALSNKKIRLEERFNNEKANLEKLLKEITSKGYDPQKLSDTRKEKEETIAKLLTDLEAEVITIKEKLNLIEA